MQSLSEGIKKIIRSFIAFRLRQLLSCLKAFKVFASVKLVDGSSNRRESRLHSTDSKPIFVKFTTLYQPKNQYSITMMPRLHCLSMFINFSSLSFAVPPHQILVYDASGRDVAGSVGPLLEDNNLVLTCEVRGGEYCRQL